MGSCSCARRKRQSQLSGLDALIGALAARGYKVLGPTVRDGAIVYDEIGGRIRPAGGLDRSPGRRALPSGAPRRRRAFRLRGGAAFVEALPASADADALAGSEVRRRRLRSSRRSGRSRSSPSLASAPARFTRSRSRTRFSSKGPMPTWATRPGGAAPSSSPSIAARREEPASASPCKPGRRPNSGFDLALTELIGGPAQVPVEAGSAAGAEVLEVLPKKARHGRRSRSRGSGRRAHREPHGPQPRHARHQGASARTIPPIRAGTTPPRDALLAEIAPWRARPASAPRWTITAT